MFATTSTTYDPSLEWNCATSDHSVCTRVRTGGEDGGKTVGVLIRVDGSHSCTLLKEGTELTFLRNMEKGKFKSYISRSNHASLVVKSISNGISNGAILKIVKGKDSIVIHRHTCNALNEISPSGNDTCMTRKLSNEFQKTHDVKTFEIFPSTNDNKHMPLTETTLKFGDHFQILRVGDGRLTYSLQPCTSCFLYISDSDGTQQSIKTLCMGIPTRAKSKEYTLIQKTPICVRVDTLECSVNIIDSKLTKSVQQEKTNTSFFMRKSDIVMASASCRITLVKPKRRLRDMRSSSSSSSSSSSYSRCSTHGSLQHVKRLKRTSTSDDPFGWNEHELGVQRDQLTRTKIISKTKSSVEAEMLYPDSCSTCGANFSLGSPSNIYLSSINDLVFDCDECYDKTKQVASQSKIRIALKRRNVALTLIELSGNVNTLVSQVSSLHGALANASPRKLRPRNVSNLIQDHLDQGALSDLEV